MKRRQGQRQLQMVTEKVKKRHMRYMSLGSRSNLGEL